MQFKEQVIALIEGENVVVDYDDAGVTINSFSQNKCKTATISVPKEGHCSYK